MATICCVQLTTAAGPASAVKPDGWVPPTWQPEFPLAEMTVGSYATVYHAGNAIRVRVIAPGIALYSGVAPENFESAPWPEVADGAFEQLITSEINGLVKTAWGNRVLQFLGKAAPLPSNAAGELPYFTNAEGEPLHLNVIISKANDTAARAAPFDPVGARNGAGSVAMLRVPDHLVSMYHVPSTTSGTESILYSPLQTLGHELAHTIAQVAGAEPSHDPVTYLARNPQTHLDEELTTPEIELYAHGSEEGMAAAKAHAGLLPGAANPYEVEALRRATAAVERTAEASPGRRLAEQVLQQRIYLYSGPSLTELSLSAELGLTARPQYSEFAAERAVAIAARSFIDYRLTGSASGWSMDDQFPHLSRQVDFTPVSSAYGPDYPPPPSADASRAARVQNEAFRSWQQVENSQMATAVFGVEAKLSSAQQPHFIRAIWSLATPENPSGLPPLQFTADPVWPSRAPGRVEVTLGEELASALNAAAAAPATVSDERRDQIIGDLLAGFGTSATAFQHSLATGTPPPVSASVPPVPSVPAPVPSSPVPPAPGPGPGPGPAPSPGPGPGPGPAPSPGPGSGPGTTPPAWASAAMAKLLAVLKGGGAAALGGLGLLGLTVWGIVWSMMGKSDEAEPEPGAADPLDGHVASMAQARDAQWEKAAREVLGTETVWAAETVADEVFQDTAKRVSFDAELVKVAVEDLTASASDPVDGELVDPAAAAELDTKVVEVTDAVNTAVSTAITETLQTDATQMNSDPAIIKEFTEDWGEGLTDSAFTPTAECPSLQSCIDQTAAKPASDKPVDPGPAKEAFNQAKTDGEIMQPPVALKCPPHCEPISLGGSVNGGSEVGVVGDHFDPALVPVGWLIAQHAGKCVAPDDSSMGSGWELLTCNQVATNQLLLVTPVGQLQVFAGGKAKCASAIGRARVTSAACDVNNSAQLWDIDQHGHVKNRASGLCLDIEKERQDDWAPLNTYSCNGRERGSNQNFELITRLTSQGAPYGLPLINPASGLCLDAPTYFQDARLDTCSGAHTQVWRYEASTSQIKYYEGDGSVCLSTDPDNYRKKGPAAAIAEYCGLGRGMDARTQWDLRPDGSIQNRASRKCLDVTREATAPGSVVGVHECDGRKGNQRWTQLWVVNATH